MSGIKGKSDLDSVEPIKLVLQYDPMTKIISVDMDEHTTYAEALGIISFAQMLVMTDWQKHHAFISHEEYDFDHYGIDEDEEE